MNDAELFQKYLSGGAYALPYLLKFSCGSLEPVYLAGNNENIEYGGNTYAAAGFEYTPPDVYGKGATLKISGADNRLIEFIENADENFRLDVVALIAANGEIQKLKQYTHFYGSVSYSETMKINFELSSDDRMDMTFPPYKFDTDMNRGNA